MHVGGDVMQGGTEDWQEYSVMGVKEMPRYSVMRGGNREMKGYREVHGRY